MQTTATLSEAPAPVTEAPATQKDNMLGICHAIGEDFGFNPIFLRIALAVTLLLNAEAAIAAYAVMGVAVVVSRLIFRKPRRAASVAVLQAPAAPARIEAGEFHALAA